MNNPLHIRFAGDDSPNGDLGPAMDGESVAQFLARTGGQLVNTQSLLLHPGDATFNGGMPVTEAIQSAIGSTITIRAVPEPAQWLQAFVAIVAVAALCGRRPASWMAGLGSWCAMRRGRHGAAGTA